MKKLSILFVCLVAMMVASMSLKAQEVTITLNPGYTWISYLGTESQDFATVLGSFTPAVGDVIMSQRGNATYRNDGQWRGNISQFQPGYGYMYKSTRTAPVQLTMSTPLQQAEVTTATPTDIRITSAVVGSTVTLPEGNHVFARGVCWGTNPNPDIDGSRTSDEAVVGSQNITISGLNPETTYYVRAYAVTDYGLAYGNQQSFTTESVPGGYVDLGLPSGTLWATCNVGADTPEDYGDYFAWGETLPKDNYDWDTYQYSNGVFYDSLWDEYLPCLTKYCNNSVYGYNGYTDNLTTLLPEDDAATANWGSEWRMPTKEEWQELYDNTTVTWTTAQGYVNGLLFTAANGNSIFLPAAGHRWENSIDGVGNYGDYWSSSLLTELVDMDGPNSAWDFYYTSGYYYMYAGNRSSGSSVRPVRHTGHISVTAQPNNGGTVTGEGTFLIGRNCTVTATPNAGYVFVNWTENGAVVSTNATYTFTVEGGRNLVANFSFNIPGAINGKFTINANGDQVYFSQGNLQYKASTSTWRFATNQYDYVGSNNSNISSTYSGWIDLFGWGTSGWNNGNTYYHPWDSNNSNGNLYGPPGQYNLTGSYANADWGVYNAISNGGNQSNQWRTLTEPEWNYVFNTRTTTSGIRYAKAKVNNVNGVILLPDDWSSSTYSLINYNGSRASFSSNTLTASQWSTLEQAGAVFLPAAGYRYGTSVDGVGSGGGYWSASYDDSSCAYYVYFSDSYLSTNYNYIRFRGQSVRLVRVAE